MVLYHYVKVMCYKHIFGSRANSIPMLSKPKDKIIYYVCTFLELTGLPEALVDHQMDVVLLIAISTT